MKTQNCKWLALALLSAVWVEARVFIDATYEGDLAAAAGVPFRIGREAAAEFHEPMAGKLYKLWQGDRKSVV